MSEMPRFAEERLANRTKKDTYRPLDSKQLPIIFFSTSAGREPVREWLRELPAAERRIIGEDIKTLQFRWPLGMPLVRSLGDGLWEVRSNLPNRIARCLFFVEDRKIVLLHSFIKKTQKTPTEDKALALKRKNDWKKAE